MASGRDKDVVDPDKNLIYTRRKQRQEKLQTRNDPLLKESTVRFPSTGWSTSLQRMLFVYKGRNGFACLSVWKKH